MSSRKSIIRIRTILLDQEKGNCTKCFYCQYWFPLKRMTLEHILPRCYGGNNNTKNCVLACKICNSLRGTIVNDIVLLKTFHKQRSICKYSIRYKKVYYRTILRLYNIIEKHAKQLKLDSQALYSIIEDVHWKNLKNSKINWIFT